MALIGLCDPLSMDETPPGLGRALPWLASDLPAIEALGDAGECQMCRSGTSFAVRMRYSVSDRVDRVPADVAVVEPEGGDFTVRRPAFPKVLGRVGRPTGTEGVVHMRMRRKSAIGLALLVGIVALVPLTQATAGGIVTLDTALTGAAEVPGPGDANGTGGATIDLDPVADEVCFEVSWRGIDRPFAAHIHRGSASIAGRVRVELFASSEPLPSTIKGVQGCVRGVDSDLIDRMVARPERFYVNVHTRAYPDGAIRGQLAPAI